MTLTAGFIDAEFNDEKERIFMFTDLLEERSHRRSMDEKELDDRIYIFNKLYRYESNTDLIDKVNKIRSLYEAVIEPIFKLPKNFKIDYSEKGAFELSALYMNNDIVFIYDVIDKRKGITNVNGRILINLARANTRELIELTVNHEIIHRIQLERSNNKENISRIKQQILDKKPNISNKERWYIDYGNYFELMAYAYTFAQTAHNNNFELKQIVNTNTGNKDFEKLKKDKKFLRYLYDYYTKIKDGWSID